MVNGCVRHADPALPRWTQAQTPRFAPGWPMTSSNGLLEQ